MQEDAKLLPTSLTTGCYRHQCCQTFQFLTKYLCHLPDVSVAKFLREFNAAAVMPLVARWLLQSPEFLTALIVAIWLMVILTGVSANQRGDLALNLTGALG